MKSREKPRDWSFRLTPAATTSLLFGTHAVLIGLLLAELLNNGRQKHRVAQTPNRTTERNNKEECQSFRL